jgi:hypothetical protein
MSTLDELPNDQRAALSLLLRQRKSYSDVATLLAIPERAIHDRAHAALAVLAPAQARALSPERRQEIGDYLLGQQPGVAERLRTRTYLANDEAARGWAQSLSSELTALTGSPPAEIPAPAAVAPAAPPAPLPTAAAQVAPAATGRSYPSRTPAPEPPFAPADRAWSAQESAPSSRLGGALLLTALVVTVAVAVILIISSGGGSKTKTSASAGKTTSTASKSGPVKGPALPMSSPSPTSHSVGVVEVLSEGSKHAFYIDAEHLPATRNFFYAIWLYNSQTSAEALSKSPAVGANHKLAGGALLPANAGEFREILLTRETSPHPTHPGKVVLRGAFKVG